MLEETPSFSDRIFKVDLTPISRPNVNFARGEPPILYTPRTTKGLDYCHEGGLGRRRHHTRVRKIKERAETPIITATPNPTSINWWPYPPWGQSTILSTPSGPVTPVATEAVSSSPAAAVTAVASSDAPKSATSLSSLIPTPTPPRAPVMSTPPPLNTLPANPGVHTSTSSHFNTLYLIPILIAVILLSAISGLLGYRWFSRRRARKGDSDDGRVGRISPFVSGPRYIPMNYDLEAGPGPSPTTAGSPSKYMPHTPHSARPLLSVITGGSSRHSSTHSTPIHPSPASAPHSASSYHSRRQSEIPTRARSRRSTVSRVSPSDYGASPQVILRSPENTVISPVSASLSDDDTVPYETIRHKSIRRGILERLQRGISRDPSRRTVQTYFSAGSIYSGTDHDISRAPSFIVPSSSPPPRVTDWTPGSGFRLFEDVTSPSRPPAVNSVSAAGFPGGQPTTSAWCDGAAIRQAVDTHPGDRWLAWTRSWASSPPPQDRFTVGPTRRRTATTQGDEKRDIVVAALPQSPPQLTSGNLHETLTFSPSGPTMLAAVPPPRAQSRARAARLRAPPARVDSGASSISLGAGHGTPAMRYAARKSAHSRVEDILARSYNSRDLAPTPTPAPAPASAPESAPTLDNPGLDAFGVRAPSMVLTEEEEGQDVVFAAGIVKRLTVADVKPLAITARDLMPSPVNSGADPFGVTTSAEDDEDEDDDVAFAAGIMQRLADADVSATTDGRHQR